MIEVIATDEFVEWYRSLPTRDEDAVRRVVELLAERGLALGAPYSSAIKGTRKHALRELRAQARPLRVFYAFDPQRNAVVILGGDKTGDKRFYEQMVPLAEAVFDTYLTELAAGLYDEEG